MKRAIINGIKGQEGSYLTEFLQSLGYEVHGIICGSDDRSEEREDWVYHGRVKSGPPCHNIDTYDPGKFTSLIYEINTAEVYHFGLQGRASVGHEMSEFSRDITGLSASTILEAIRKSGIMCRFCHASSGEIFGSTPAPQREATPSTLTARKPAQS